MVLNHVLLPNHTPLSTVASHLVQLVGKLPYVMGTTGVVSKNAFPNIRWLHLGRLAWTQRLRTARASSTAVLTLARTSPRGIGCDNVVLLAESE